LTRWISLLDVAPVGADGYFGEDEDTEMWATRHGRVKIVEPVAQSFELRARF
jgi:hypothetical protein